MRLNQWLGVLLVLLCSITPALGAEVEALARDVEARATPEARFVKACDKLHLMLKVTTYEQAGLGNLAEFWANEANYPSEEFASVAELFNELRERRLNRGRT